VSPLWRAQLSNLISMFVLYASVEVASNEVSDFQILSSALHWPVSEFQSIVTCVQSWPENSLKTQNRCKLYSMLAWMQGHRWGPIIKFNSRTPAANFRTCFPKWITPSRVLLLFIRTALDLARTYSSSVSHSNITVDRGVYFPLDALRKPPSHDEPPPRTTSYAITCSFFSCMADDDTHT